jgi:AcrR family transcriptional regulator
MGDPAKIDGRREAGERTRQRLLDATLVLLAERGEDGVTLRDITTAADANIAAVSYHFGSLSALVRAATEQAIAAMIDGQIERMQALGSDATIEQIAAALGHTTVMSLGRPGCAEQQLLRIMARVIAHPPPELAEWMAAALARSDAYTLPLLRRALPDVSDEELRFRRESAIGIINFLVTGSMRIDLHGRSSEEIEHLLIPVLSGALAGGCVPA